MSTLNHDIDIVKEVMALRKGGNAKASSKIGFHVLLLRSQVLRMRILFV